MRVAIAIINDCFALDALFGYRQINVDNTLRAWRSGKRRNFQSIEGLACVAIGDLGQVTQRIFLGADSKMAQTAFRVAQGALQQIEQYLLAERAEFENLRTRDER